MRGQLVNELQLNLRLAIPAGARLLVMENIPEVRTVQSGQSNGEAQEYQATVSVQTEGRPYLPGSSVKGALRSRAEFIANSLNGTGPGTCHLFGPYFDAVQVFDGAQDYGRMSCDKRFNIRMAAGSCAAGERYKDACPACQLFGHSHFGGRLRVSDFKAVENVPVVAGEQPGIAIDRVSGGVAGDKLYKQDFISAGAFEGLLTIENFSLWQIGWLGMLLQDLRDGLLRVGHKTTSGGGKVSIASADVVIRVVRGTAAVDDTVPGVEALLSAAQREAYGYQDVGPAALPGVSWRAARLWQEAALGDGEALWRAARPHTAAYLQGFEFDESTMGVTALQNLLDAQAAA